MDASPLASSLTAAPPTTSPADAAKRAQIHKTAQAFEASFISGMLGQMFVGVEPQAPFSGGAGEAAFRSFLNDAIAKAVVRRGGVGLSKSISAEMLKLKGLSG